MTEGGGGRGREEAQERSRGGGDTKDSELGNGGCLDCGWKPVSNML